MGTIQQSQIAIGNYHYVSWSFEYFLDSVKKIGVEILNYGGQSRIFVWMTRTGKVSGNFGNK